MSSRITRRDALKVLGGVAVGTLITPVPWKLLDDLAIRTQNEGWVTHPKRGVRGFVPTHCSLCPAGCALNLRCVGNVPVAVSAVPGHPEACGTPCPYGVVLHHFAGHPDRLREAASYDSKRGALRPRPDWEPTLRSWVHDAVERAGANSVAILDPNPRRALSSVYRCFAASLGGGLYLALPGEDPLLTSMERVGSGPDATEFAYDLSSCRTVLSFSAPVCEGWGTPGRVLSQFRGAPGESSRPNAFLIQATPVPSVSARLADRWLRIRPHREGALALGLTRILLDRGWFTDSPQVRKLLARESELLSLVTRYSLDEIADATGLQIEEIEETAWRLSHQGPALIIAGRAPSGAPSEEPVQRALHSLNVLLGATRADGSLRQRRALPLARCLRKRELAPKSRLEDVADASLELLIIDGSRLSAPLPWSEIRRKLAPGARTVALTPYGGHLARSCDLALPMSAPLEGWDEVQGAVDVTRPRFAAARPVFRTDFSPLDPVELLHRLSPDPALLSELGKSPDHVGLLRSQCDALFELGSGTIVEWGPDGAREKKPGSSTALWEALERGGEWLGERSKEELAPNGILFPAKMARSLAANVEASLNRPLTPRRLDQLTVLTLGARVASAGEPVPPLVAKLCRESTLLPRPGVVYLNPETARAFGLREGARIGHPGLGAIGEATIHLTETVQPSSLVVPEGLALGAFGDEERS